MVIRGYHLSRAHEYILMLSNYTKYAMNHMHVRGPLKTNAVHF